MPSQPLTPAGVQAKIAELYALPDTQLAAQADLVRTNFRDWVADNFTLSTEQLSHLDDLNEQWVQLAACQTAFAMNYRLSIEFVVPTPSGASKLIGSSSDMRVYDNGGAIEAEGGLTFSIEYE
jgi:hypothetical protein